ncbi:hypothetical protein [uncultured Legionella sp.]|uniref:hypothetical protein n=1 Tax=uncultured Legionella sp. TaxID=210934 RepID=UPI002613AA17|nr:hypothetical protein [uncultured Legionella sp.]
MAFNLVEYDKLKNALIECIKTEIKSFDEKKDTSPDKLFESAKCCSPARRIQAQFILTTINILDAYPSNTNEEKVEKARILNTLAFCIHEEIDDSYWLLSSDRSRFKLILAASLELKKGNEPAETDLHDMYPSLIKCLKDNLYNEGDVRRGYLSQPKFVIEGFSVKEYIDTLDTKNLANSLALAKKAQEKERQLQPSSSSWWFFGGSTSSTPAQEQKATKLTAQDDSAHGTRPQ